MRNTLNALARMHSESEPGSFRLRSPGSRSEMVVLLGSSRRCVSLVTLSTGRLISVERLSVFEPAPVGSTETRQCVDPCATGRLSSVCRIRSVETRSVFGGLGTSDSDLKSRLSRHMGGGIAQQTCVEPPQVG